MERRPLGERLVRLVLLVLPPFTVLVVGISWLVAAAPSSFVYVRLLGGPTDAEGPWTGRVQAIERDGEAERPVARAPLRVAWAGEADFEWRGETDDEGWADVELERPPGAGDLQAEVFIGDDAHPAAQGRAHLSTTAWLAGARRSSGRIEGKTEGPLQFEVIVSRGALAVPFPGEVRIRVQRGEVPVAGAELRWAGRQLDVTLPAPVRTDAQGRARLVVAPRGHATSLELRVDSGQGTSRWFSTLPVVPGAMSAELTEGRLRVRAPIERDVAWYTWVTLGGRLGGGRMVLSADGSGASSGEVSVPPEVLDHAALDGLWVVVSSEPDARSPAAVGWPLGDQYETLDLSEPTLLDGAPAAEARAALRKSRLRWAVAAYGALATVVVLVLFGHRVRADRVAAWARLSAEAAAEQTAAERGVAERAAEEPGGEERAARTAAVGESRIWPLAVGLLCIGLGLTLVTLVGLLWVP